MSLEYLNIILLDECYSKYSIKKTIDDESNFIYNLNLFFTEIKFSEFNKIQIVKTINNLNKPTLYFNIDVNVFDIIIDNNDFNQYYKITYINNYYYSEYIENYYFTGENQQTAYICMLLALNSVINNYNLLNIDNINNLNNNILSINIENKRHIFLNSSINDTVEYNLNNIKKQNRFNLDNVFIQKILKHKTNHLMSFYYNISRYFKFKINQTIVNNVYAYSLEVSNINPNILFVSFHKSIKFVIKNTIKLFMIMLIEDLYYDNVYVLKLDSINEPDIIKSLKYNKLIEEIFTIKSIYIKLNIFNKVTYFNNYEEVLLFIKTLLNENIFLIYYNNIYSCIFHSKANVYKIFEYMALKMYYDRLEFLPTNIIKHMTCDCLINNKSVILQNNVSYLNSYFYSDENRILYLIINLSRDLKTIECK